MRYRIKRQAQNRLHLILERGRLTKEEADILYYALIERRDVVRASVYVRTGEVSVQYRSDPQELLAYLDSLKLNEESGVKIPSVSARATSEEYKEKIIGKLIRRYMKRLLLPASIRAVFTVKDAIPFVWHGLKDVFRGKFSAEIVHASAISASLLI